MLELSRVSVGGKPSVVWEFDPGKFKLESSRNCARSSTSQRHQQGNRRLQKHEDVPSTNACYFENCHNSKVHHNEEDETDRSVVAG